MVVEFKAMNKIFIESIIIAIITMAFVGCGMDSPERKKEQEKRMDEQHVRLDGIYQKEFDNAHVVTKGDCEYLMFTSGKQGFATHKGDCSNPIHCHNK